jgi:hypothetical protein
MDARMRPSSRVEPVARTLRPVCNGVEPLARSLARLRDGLSHVARALLDFLEALLCAAGINAGFKLDLAVFAHGVPE